MSKDSRSAFVARGRSFLARAAPRRAALHSALPSPRADGLPRATMRGTRPLIAICNALLLGSACAFTTAVAGKPAGGLTPAPRSYWVPAVEDLEFASTQAILIYTLAAYRDIFGRAGVPDGQTTLQSFFDERLDFLNDPSRDSRYDTATQKQIRTLDTMTRDFRVELFVPDPQCAVTSCEYGGEKVVTVAFRGTVALFDWIQDARILKVTAPGPLGDVRVHKGFDAEFRRNVTTAAGEAPIKDVLIDKVKSLVDRDGGWRSARIVVTGHSLGAAMSHLFGYYLAQEPSLATLEDGSQRCVDVISLASPRVGDGKWKDANDYFIKQKMMRVCRLANENDIVTAAPSVNYKHVGTAVRMKARPGAGAGAIEADVFDSGDFRHLMDFTLLKDRSADAHDGNLYWANVMKLRTSGYPPAH